MRNCSGQHKHEKWSQRNTVNDTDEENLDIQDHSVQQSDFQQFVTLARQQAGIEDILLAHRITDSGVPNRYGCRIQLKSHWNLDILEELLDGYEDMEVVEWLRYGFSISRNPNAADPEPATTNHMGATLFPEAIDRYIEKELRYDAIIGPFNFPPFTHRIGISPLSTRKKKDSKERRVIMDLSFPENRAVNSEINKNWYCGQQIKLTFPTIDTLTKRIFELGKNCLVWKRDLQRFFRQLPLCPMDFSLSGFRWRNKLYFSKMVPMGLTSAAYVAQRTTCAVTYIHRKEGFWSINYLDDFGSAENQETAHDSYQEMGNILKNIGIAEATEKAVAPTTRMDFLGNTVDTVKMTIEVSAERRQELLTLLQKWLNKTGYYLKELQSLIGKLSFITNCVRPGRIFLSRLIDKLKQQEQQKQTNNIIDQEMKKDLNWWLQFLPKFDGTSLIWLQEEYQEHSTIETDASLIGGGATYGKEFIHFKFTHDNLKQTANIAQRELFTILVAIKIWKKRLTGKLIRVKTDSMNSMFALNKGKSNDQFMLQCLREIAWISSQEQFMIRARYVNTKSNEIPDSLSRWYITAEARRKFKRLTNNTWKRKSVINSILKFEYNW